MSANRIADAITALQIIGVTDDRILTALVDLKPEATAERWQAGDVVFAAEASELWVVVGLLGDDPLWITVNLRTGNTSRGGSPPPGAVLDRRDGKRALPEPTDEDVSKVISAALAKPSLPLLRAALRDALIAHDERRGVRRP